MPFTATELYKPVLYELNTGIIASGVPVEDGAIQVGTYIRPRTSFSRLVIAVEPDSISFSREDGQKLQIDDNDERLTQDRRVRLLTNPIDKLTLRRSIGPMGLLQVEGETEITETIPLRHVCIM
jgi:hypothetical protein